MFGRRAILVMALPAVSFFVRPAWGTDCNLNGIDDAEEASWNGLVGYYFDDRIDPNGNPPYKPHWTLPYQTARIDATIDLPDGAPEWPPSPLSSNRFSVRWVGRLLTNAAGTYRLSVEHDDGFRLYLNGNLLPWMSDDGSSTHSVDVVLAANTRYHIRLDYFENSGDQKCFFRWTQPGGSLELVPSSNLFPIFDGNDNGIPDECEFGDCNFNGIPDIEDISSGRSVDCNNNGVPDECDLVFGDCDGNGIVDVCEPSLPTNGLVGQYWSSMSGAGNYSERLLVRTDPNVNFDWGTGAPATGLPTNAFTVRWTGTVTTPSVAGSYVFYTKTDDGGRLWVNNQLLVDQWHSSSGAEYSGTITLAASTRYLIRMDYYEDTGDARAWLYWQPPGQSKVIIPTTALRPMSDADGDGYPDGCPDCNQNGIPDSVDILNGTAQDCDNNGVPDSCDILPPPPVAYWRFEETADPVIDWGSHGLHGTSAGNPQRVTTVPLAEVPQNGLANTQSLDTNWQSTTSAGRFSVPDTGGLLTMGDHNFTIEAWVKLNTLSDTSSADMRQTLLQKKPLSTGDKNLDYSVLVQRGNFTISPNYGKTASFTGRELVLVFGDGTSFWGMTSNLEIADTDWHFISVAHDTANHEVRFGLDTVFESVAFSDNTHVTNSGPLLVGGHQSLAGTYNYFVRGLIDELRITREVLPATQLLNVTNGLDCNANGVPDSCDISAGTSEDCNANAIPDECELTLHDCNVNQVPDDCDIANGTSQDCNSNGIPDECELSTQDCNTNGVIDSCDIQNGTSQDCNGSHIPDECEVPPGGTGPDCNQNGIPDSCEPDCNHNGIPDECDVADGTSQDCNGNLIPDECDMAPEVAAYVWDDGWSESDLGFIDPGANVVWLNHFTVKPNTGAITQIDIAYGRCEAGIPVTLYVWSDPDGDGDPADAHVLASAATTVQNPSDPGPAVFNTVSISPVDVGPPGTSFFIGALASIPGYSFIMSFDQTPPNHEESWRISERPSNPIDPNNLHTGNPGSYFGKMSANWLIRGIAIEDRDCNNNGIPDDCDITAGTSQDIDGDGIPDECEPDCNNNGMPDDQDIRNGTSLDCQPDGIPDECQLTIGDCNHNGVPDECDIAQGTSPDCDDNMVPDECDVANGAADCQPDDIPDVCQLGEPYVPTYLVDDGTGNRIIGLTGAGAHLAWLNHFTVMSGGEVIENIQIAFGNMAANTPFTLYIWSDPNGDGNPDDAQVLATAPALMPANSTSDILNTTPIGPINVGPAGTSFFAGAIITQSTGTDGPARIDQSSLLRQSWAVAEDPSNPIDPNNLDAPHPDHLFGLIDDLYPIGAGNWMIRVLSPEQPPPYDCNRNTIPDSCDIAAGDSLDTNGNGIPDECEGDSCATLAGDLDGNNLVDGMDVQGFVDCYLQGPSVTAGCRCADLNAPQPDGVLDGADLTAFINLLLGQ